MMYIPAEAEFGLLHALHLIFSCTIRVPVSASLPPVIKTK